MWRIGVAIITVSCLMLVVIFNDHIELTMMQGLQAIAFGILDIAFLIWLGQMIYRVTEWMPFGLLHPALIGWLVGTYASFVMIVNLSRGLPFFYYWQ